MLIFRCREREAHLPTSSEETISSWTWTQPSANQLQQCLRALGFEQRELALSASKTALSMNRLLQVGYEMRTETSGNCSFFIRAFQYYSMSHRKNHAFFPSMQRIVILERYFVAFSRQPSVDSKQQLQSSAIRTSSKSMKTSATYSADINKIDSTNQNRQIGQSAIAGNAAASPYASTTNPYSQHPGAGGGYMLAGSGHAHAALGLAHVGTRAALSFAFAFLRRAWRNGDDLDLCTELLQVS